MKRTFALIIIICFLLPSCNSAPPTTEPEQLSLQYTAASIPWLADLSQCAGTNNVSFEQRGADFLDPQSADVVIRIGLPKGLGPFVYQISTDDLLVIVDQQNPINNLTAAQVFGLFTGQIQNWKDIDGADAPVQVWVFAAGEDLQQVFEQTVMEGSPVTSLARLATSPEEMLQVVEKDSTAIGIINRRNMAGNVTDVYMAASGLPVLAITLAEPQGNLAQVIACMQK